MKDYKKVLLIVFLAISLLFLGKTSSVLVYDEVIPNDKELIVFNKNTLLPIAEPINPDPEIAQFLSVIVTAYSSTPWETWGDPFITAAGTGVRDGIVANNMLPFGTKIRLPEIYGDKIFVVEDRMHYRKGSNHFDLWKPSHTEAKNFGVVYTYVEVLEN